MDQMEQGQTAGPIERASAAQNDTPQQPSETDRSGAMPQDSDVFERLKHSRREFLAIFDSVPAMIWYKGRDGTILRANQCAADSIGAGVKDLIGRNYYELFPDNASISRELDQRVMQTGCPVRSQLRCFTPLHTKGTRWALVDRFPLRDEEGRIQGVMVFAQDITEKKTAEDRLVRAKKEIELRNEQLRAAVAKAEKAAESACKSNLLKSEILASSSHDLRTPMNSIIGFADLLLETSLDDEQRQYLTTISESAKGLLSLVDDILDFARLEANKLKIAIVPCLMNEFIGQIQSMIEVSARRKGIDFQVHLDPRLPASFHTDPLRLKQCLVNLLGNAVKFTEQGYVKLYVLQPNSARACIRFEVEDTGIGIAAERQHEIFKMFTQADDLTGRKYGGSGLGLTITRRLVDLLGGTIAVESRPGQGSKFSIVLPLVSGGSLRMPGTETIAENRENHDSEELSNKKILLAETDLPSQLTMNLLLRRAGMTVRAVNSADEIRPVLRSDAFDLLVLDGSLCGSSAELIKQLHQEGWALPIVAILDSEMPNEQSILQTGAIVLTRPVSRKALYETISEQMRLKQFGLQLGAIQANEELTQDMSEANGSGEVQKLPALLQKLQDTLRECDRAQAEQIFSTIQTVSATIENPLFIEKINTFWQHFQLSAADHAELSSAARDLELLCGDIFKASQG
ncbi:MAG: PAS domain-containing protein [Planctomycetaceae bacterium]|nr:PAS domain-containing protein [Planctomycetaceae bacterium]